MCNLVSEGTQHGCGHYIITKKVHKVDCANRYCVHSMHHPPRCPDCSNCQRYLGPDVSETTTLVSPKYCTACAYWYHGPGARPHAKQQAA